MLHFENRQQAGIWLADQLVYQYPYPLQNTIVLGLARGGLPVAYEVSKKLNVPLDVVIVRKLGYMGNEEYAFGAIGPEDVTTLYPDVAYLPTDYVVYVTQKESAELKRRERVYRAWKRPLSSVVRNANVILVDDGIATGASAETAIKSMRQLGAKTVTVVAPVGAADSVNRLSRLADTVIVPLSDPAFVAVGAYYASFPQVTDDQVISILQRR